MITPPYLKTGATIGIVSTASKIDREIITNAANYLISIGFRVVIGSSAYNNYNQFAGTDLERSNDLQQLLNDDSIDAIICSRGGYGTLRTIENIDWSKFKKRPKWIVGFSDITVLHSKLNILKVASIHGVMTKFFTENNKVTQSFTTLLNALKGNPLIYEITPSEYNRIGNAGGELIGGNLSILYSLRGTSIDIDTSGKILFIEDLSEYLYHLDRIMMNLKVGNKLANLSGLIVGSFTGMKDNDTPFGKCVEEIILDAVSDYNYPVVFNFPAGHQKTNYALKFGETAQLNISEKKVVFKQK